MKKIDVKKIKEEHHREKIKPKVWKSGELQLLWDLTTGENPVSLKYLFKKGIFNGKRLNQLTVAKSNITSRTMGWEVKE